MPPPVPNTTLSSSAAFALRKVSVLAVAFTTVVTASVWVPELLMMLLVPVVPSVIAAAVRSAPFMLRLMPEPPDIVIVSPGPGVPFGFQLVVVPHAAELGLVHV